MKEREFNSIISRSLNIEGLGFKIPDTFSTGNLKHPSLLFDGFGYFKGNLICWESKYLQKPQAFNFNKLQEHQINNLIGFYENVDSCISLFLIGVNYGRADNRVYYWANEDLYNIRKRKAEADNILKKELDTLTNYLVIKKGVIDFNEILF